MYDQEKLANHRRTRLLQWMEKYQVNRSELSRRLAVGRAYLCLLLIERAPGEKQKTRHFGEKSARSIEKKLGLVEGYLDCSDTVQVTSFAGWAAPADLPDGSYALVPRSHVALANGQVVFTVMSLPDLAFTKELLAAQGVTHKDNLHFLEVQDDSMQGYLHKGNTVMLDTGKTTILDRSVYVIGYADGLRVRRLEKTFDGGVRLISDNPAYKTEELSAEQAKSLMVVGRVLWRMG